MSVPEFAAGRPDLHVVDIHALEPCTAVSAARQIAEHVGCSRQQAEAMVGRYLDEVSDQVGVSVHQWGLDAHDLAAILTDNGHEVAGAGDRPDALDQARAAVAEADHAHHAGASTAAHEPADENVDSDADEEGWQR
ncbi:hypothetical protein [Pseudonocardia humida]|uniref:Uncharacterized protein n=1 Tax=Pseudonocardia humida TaxID=2800819 RepID=A0ABT1A7I5_9PSEU|nr:hypothetical protein [Pseudonocardia humida]MCO1658896.1 hypothetical protein [Pseudonocardia humida]